MGFFDSAFGSEDDATADSESGRKSYGAGDGRRMTPLGPGEWVGEDSRGNKTLFSENDARARELGEALSAPPTNSES